MLGMLVSVQSLRTKQRRMPLFSLDWIYESLRSTQINSVVRIFRSRNVFWSNSQCRLIAAKY